METQQELSKANSFQLQFQKFYMKKKIGPYEIQKTIGKGTFGLVKQGIHMPTSEKVAIKILEKAKILDRKDHKNIIQELTILKKIRHPHLVRLYQLIETSSKIYIVTEYVAGGELYQNIISKGKLEESVAKRYFWQLMQGLKYLHDNNIVHRDLKPENIMTDSDSTIKIIDFGLSREYSEGQKLDTSCGSPCYAAPEMIAGEKYNPQQVDVWSAGIILYAMLCGCLPFEDTNYKVLYAKVLRGKYETPKHLSEESKSLLAGIINTDPTKRLTIHKILEHPWLENLEDSDSNQHQSIVTQMAYPLLQRIFNMGVDEIKYEISQSPQSQINIHLHLLVKQLGRNYRNRSSTILKERSNSNNRKRIISEIHKKPAAKQLPFKGLMNLNNLLDGNEDEVKKEVTAKNLRHNITFKGCGGRIDGKEFALRRLASDLYYMESAPGVDPSC